MDDFELQRRLHAVAQQLALLRVNLLEAKRAIDEIKAKLGL
jgi:hypothetical protein